jgi:hypothetical protein
MTRVHCSRERRVKPPTFEQHKMIIKATFNGETRKWKGDSASSFANLLEQLSTLFHTEIAAIQYVDEDGDLIVCDTEIEWRELASLSDTLKVQVISKSAKAQSVPPSEDGKKPVVEKPVVIEKPNVEKLAGIEMPVATEKEEKEKVVNYPMAEGDSRTSRPIAQRWRGVQCDNCNASDFPGQRFKCLMCPDYDLCQGCFDLQQMKDSPLGDVHVAGHRFLNMGHAAASRATSPLPALLEAASSFLSSKLEKPLEKSSASRSASRESVKEPRDQGPWLVAEPVDDFKKPAAETEKKEPVSFSEVMQNLATAFGSVRAFSQDEAPGAATPVVQPASQIPPWLAGMMSGSAHQPPHPLATGAGGNMANILANMTGQAPASGAPWWLPMVSQAIASTDWRGVASQVASAAQSASVASSQASSASQAASQASQMPQATAGPGVVSALQQLYSAYQATQQPAAGQSATSQSAAGQQGGPGESGIASALQQLYTAYQTEAAVPLESANPVEVGATIQDVIEENVTDSTGRSIPPPPSQALPASLPASLVDLLRRVGNEVGRDSFQ